MEVVDRYGLALALVEPHELADEPWTRAGRRLDVARVADPDGAADEALAAHGFLRKPKAVTWLTELGPEEEAFLARLRPGARKDIRWARRQAAAAGLREGVEDPVTPDVLEEFLALYAERVAAMRFGVPFALGHRDAVLHGPDKFYGVFAREENGELAGGCLVREQPERDAAVLRFSAVTARRRASSLARVLYLSALRIARAKGYRYATLADEPNLMGHLTKPGLFLFKANLGFEPVPSQRFGDPDGGDEADLVLSLAALNDPTFLLAYAGPAQERTLAGHLFRSVPGTAGRYTAPFLAPTTVHLVGGGAGADGADGATAVSGAPGAVRPPVA